MDERTNRLMNVFGDMLTLSDQIHTGENDSDETYDRLRTRLARWNMAVENVAWLASIDMGDVKGRCDGELQVHRLVKACLGARLWMIREKHLRLDIHLEEATVKGNSDLMKLIFQNLLDNPDIVANYKSNASDYITGKYSWDLAVEQMIRVYRGEKVEYNTVWEESLKGAR